MSNFQTIANDLTKSLSLQYEPAGVAIYRNSDPLPESVPFTDKELKSYCQAVILAGEGEVLLLENLRFPIKLLWQNTLAYPGSRESNGLSLKGKWKRSILYRTPIATDILYTLSTFDLEIAGRNVIKIAISHTKKFITP